MIAALCCSIALENYELPKEFFPAHLSVGLIDAVFHSQLQKEEAAVPSVERYCRRFGISRTRADRWEPPPVGEQESLSDLIRHFDELGVDRMMDEVFQDRCHSPGTTITRAENVLFAARTLKHAGVEFLQDVQARPPEEIEVVLRSMPGGGNGTVRMFLMYTGGDDFVLGDSHVRSFVANAIDRKAVPATRAVALVRSAAYELILSPRFLDREIWRLGVRTRRLVPQARPHQGAGFGRG